MAAEAVAACATVAADARTCFGFVAVGLFRGRLCGEFLGRSGLPQTYSCPPEAAARALTAMLVGILGNRRRPVWRDVFGLRLALGTSGSTVGGQLCRCCYLSCILLCRRLGGLLVLHSFLCLFCLRTIFGAVPCAFAVKNAIWPALFLLVFVPVFALVALPTLVPGLSLWSCWRCQLPLFGLRLTLNVEHLPLACFLI